MDVMVPNWQVKEFVGAERESGRVMKVQVIIGNAVWEFLFCYTLFCYQKEEFYDFMDKAVTNEKVLTEGDLL